MTTLQYKIELDENHVYRVDGKVVPGFSEIKTAMGIGGNAFYTEDGRDEGIALHQWLIFLARGGVSNNEPDSRIAGGSRESRSF